jgi:hypothetical protein
MEESKTGEEEDFVSLSKMLQDADKKRTTTFTKSEKWKKQEEDLQLLSKMLRDPSRSTSELDSMITKRLQLFRRSGAKIKKDLQKMEEREQQFRKIYKKDEEKLERLYTSVPMIMVQELLLKYGISKSFKDINEEIREMNNQAKEK